MPSQATGEIDAANSAAGESGEQGKQPNTSDAGASGEQHNPQAAINAVVARERKAADQRIADLEAKWERRLAEITTKKSSADDDAAFRDKLEAARKPVLEELDAERSKRTALNTRLITAEIRSAAQASVDPDEVAVRLAGRVRVTDAGDFEVVDADGRPEYGAKGQKSIGELVADLLTAKPYLAKAAQRDGANYQGAKPSTGAPDLKQQIAEADKKGDFVTANALRAQVAYAALPR